MIGDRATIEGVTGTLTVGDDAEIRR